MFIAYIFHADLFAFVCILIIENIIFKFEFKLEKVYDDNLMQIPEFLTVAYNRATIIETALTS